MGDNRPFTPFLSVVLVSAANPTPPQLQAGLSQALNALRQEAHALLAVQKDLAKNSKALQEALRLIINTADRGAHVVVTGMGKSGHVGRKIAATLSSTGTPAFFLHPAEAAHGDLGMVGAHDVVLALSFSGESAEIVALLPSFKRMSAPIIALTGHPDSTLARSASVALILAIGREACPHNLAPTSSTTAQMAVGDALALGTLVARGFSAEDFGRFHPGGALGKRLITVADIMHLGHEVPCVSPQNTLAETVSEITRGGLGMAAVVDGTTQAIVGVFTDGDFRRLFLSAPPLMSTTIDTLMHRSPKTIALSALAAEAVAMMDKARINQLLVTDAQGALVGAINLHDILNHRVL